MGACQSKQQVEGDMSPRPLPVSQFADNSNATAGSSATKSKPSTDPTNSNVTNKATTATTNFPVSKSPSASESAQLLALNEPLPDDPAALKSLVQSLQHTLAQRELVLKEKEKELASEKAQRVQSATGVLNQAMKIIRPSTSAKPSRDSFSAGQGATPSGSPILANNHSGISPSLIQLHEKQKALAAEAASASIIVTNPDGTHTNNNSISISHNSPNQPTTTLALMSNASSLSAILPAPQSALNAHGLGLNDKGVAEVDHDSNNLRRELMEVLLAFAENEIIAPNAEKRDGTHTTMNEESFSQVINSSALDQLTKQWLTAEFTRDQPAMGAGTRQRHVSVVRPNGNAGTSANFLYSQSKLLISPDLISLSELSSWDFDPTQYSHEILIVQAFKMFESFELISRFKMDPNVLSTFLVELSKNYIASNPYHNFFHGVDVMHCCWMYLRQSSVIPFARLRSLDILAFLISAICHDLGHPGTCFDTDTRVLTNHGYLFGDEMKTKLASGETVLFACYEKDTKSIVYRPCQGNKLSVDFVQWKGEHPGDEPFLVEFMDAAESKRWNSEESHTEEDEDESHGVSLRVTPNHTMFASWSDAHSTSTHTNRNPAGDSLRADFFLDSTRHFSKLSLLSVAENGHTCTKQQQQELQHILAGFNLPPCSDCDHLSSSHSTSCPINSFLHSYGAWVSTGCIEPSAFHSVIPASVVEPSFAPWTLTHLNRDQCQALIDGFQSFNIPSEKQSSLVTSKTLKDQLQVILLHAGYSARCRTITTHSQPQFQLTWSTDSFPSSHSAPSLSPQHDVKRVNYNGPVWCISVDHPDHLIVAQRAIRSAKHGGEIIRESRPVIVGQSNIFQVSSGSELAMIYNDKSVLENYHNASTFRILTMPECSILSGLSREEWFDARKTIISNILATDMSHHFEMVAKLDSTGLLEKLERITAANKEMAPLNAADAIHSRLPSSDAGFDGPSTTVLPSGSASSLSPSSGLSPIVPIELTRDEITQLLNVLLHSADISNPAKPWRIAKIWGDRIQAENFNQGDLERIKGLAVSPFMDRNQENQPQTSINFIDFIVAPLAAAIVRAFPSLVTLAENLIKNRKIWHQSLLDRLTLSMRDVTGAALVAKENERKSLTNKAQIFRNCFVIPMRKIAESQAALKTADAQSAAINAGLNTNGALHLTKGAGEHHHSIAEEEEEEEHDGPQFHVGTEESANPPRHSPRHSASPSPSPETPAAGINGIVLSSFAVHPDDDAETKNLVADAADQLLRSVQTIAKRRHSLREAASSAASDSGKNSQPQTPVPAKPLASGEMLSHLVLPSASVQSSYTPSGSPIVGLPPAHPRRVSVSKMAQQMLEGDVHGTVPAVGVNFPIVDDPLSPTLSPESQAAVDSVVQQKTLPAQQ